jgi:4-amino-4-deoxy-L-arabinose transferase-like glycosyltransferase
MRRDGASLRRTVEERRFLRALALIALAALAWRMAIRLAVGVEDYWTEGYTFYAELARNLAAGRGYALDGEAPGVFRVPLYPLFIVAVGGTGGGPWPLIVAQALLSSATAAIAGLLARRMAGPLAGLLAAALFAAWPYAAWHNLTLHESGLFTFLAALATLLAVLLVERRSVGLALATGLLLGLALLTRSSLLPYVALLVAALVLPDAAGTAPRRRLRSAAVMLAALVLTLSPWLARMEQHTGRLALAADVGTLLFIGNHPLTFSHYPEGSIDRSRDAIFAAEPPEQQAEAARLARDPAALDDWYRARALRFIAADPAGFLVAAARKNAAAFGPFPSPRKGGMADWLYAAGWVPFLGLALAGLWLRRRQWRVDWPLTVHFASFIAATGLFWAHTAHRSYLDPYVAVFAAVALAALAPARWRIVVEHRLKGE